MKDKVIVSPPRWQVGGIDEALLDLINSTKESDSEQKTKVFQGQEIKEVDRESIQTHTQRGARGVGKV
eukprot:3409607-Rhodomonas_salina.1